jgi:hypothetical protein
MWLLTVVSATRTSLPPGLVMKKPPPIVSMVMSPKLAILFTVFSFLAVSQGCFGYVREW